LPPPQAEDHLARQAPVGGSYRGVSPMGLFWSQHRVRARSAPAPAADATATTLTVSIGTHRAASTTVTQLLSEPGVIEHAETVCKVGFFGEYFARAGVTRRPAVVVWGGSEGDSRPAIETRSARGAMIDLGGSAAADEGSRTRLASHD
jgi:hypothetical protein